MVEIVSVRFSERSKSYFFDPSGLTIETDEHVIVETANGLEYGICVRGNHQVSDARVVQPLRPVIRIATDTDKRSVENAKERERETFEYCQEKIASLGLEMKLVNVEYGFEGNKVLFFFTSDGRVDFRELVKDLAGKFRARIELRQIGVRDEAKMLGGLGVCGKQFCCSQFLTEFHPVSIKMAKTQGLSLNPTKISGVCGRLMCCLKYEEAAYESLVKKAPKIGAFVETPSGKGSVINVNILRGNAKVRLEDGVDATLKTFTFDELAVLGGKGRRAEYIAARDQGKLEEAGFTVTPPPKLARTLENRPKKEFDAEKRNTQKKHTHSNNRSGDSQKKHEHPPKRQNNSQKKHEHQPPKNKPGKDDTATADSKNAPFQKKNRHNYRRRKPKKTEE